VAAESISKIISPSPSGSLRLASVRVALADHADFSILYPLSAELADPLLLLLIEFWSFLLRLFCCLSWVFDQGVVPNICLLNVMEMGRCILGKLDMMVFRQFAIEVFLVPLFALL
jgi:hypothetical protein